MEKFQELVEQHHHYARDWKARTGGKVIGYFCTYVPEEILYAAGILPVRVIGSHEPQDVTEPHIFGIFCPLSRDMLAQGLQGRYDYLDGVVMARSCMHMLNAYCSWELHIPTDYKFFISMPSYVQYPGAKVFLTKELAAFKRSLERWLGKPIAADDLDRAIEVYNTNRRLLRQIYDLGKAERPLLTGAEAMEITLSSQLTDKAEHNQLLSEALKEMSQRRDGPEPGARLMLIGSENDDTEFLRLVESLGGAIVVDDHCTGTRYFWNEVIPEEDPLAAIASRYIERPPCPNKDFPERRRWPHLLKLIEDYNVQGVVIVQQKFCDTFEWEIPALLSLFKEMEIPNLFLEYDLAMPPGQFRTRIEAFLETLQLELA